jgi:hypothetical protein
MVVVHSFKWYVLEVTHLRSIPCDMGVMRVIV